MLHKRSDGCRSLPYVIVWLRGKIGKPLGIRRNIDCRPALLSLTMKIVLLYPASFADAYKS